MQLNAHNYHNTSSIDNKTLKTNDLQGLKFKKSVCKQIIEHRKKGRKVSMSFVQITARKRMKVLQLDKSEGFKGSVGWFCGS